jgi:CHAD domain-containing protein
LNPYKVIKKHLADFALSAAGIPVNVDIEYLHRMRVASRRLRTALATFKQLLPAGKAQVWRADIRAVARTLGTARDCDIQQAFVRRIINGQELSEHKTALGELLEFLKYKRQTIQAHILKELDSFKNKNIVQDLHKTLDVLADREAPSMGALCQEARKKVVRRLDDYLSFKDYVWQPEKIKALHRMRIAAKHLRYTLENLAPLYGKKINVFIEEAHRIQTVLGELHDLDIWIGQLPFFIAKKRNDEAYREALTVLGQYCVALRKKTYKEFVRIWKEQKKENLWPKLLKCIRSSTKI